MPAKSPHPHSLATFTAIFALLSALVFPALTSGQETTPKTVWIEVPDTVHTQGISPIDSAGLGGLTPYENLRSASFRDWHPSERRMLIGTRFADSTQLHEVTLPGGSRRQLTFFDEPVSGGLYRPGRPKQIAYLRDEGGSEDFQIFLLDRAKNSTRRLTDGVHRHASPLWSPDGRLLAFTGNARNGRDTDLYLVDPDGPATGAGAPRRVAEAEGTWFLVDWSRDGGRILLIRYLSVSESQLLVVDVGTGVVTRLDPAEGEPAAWVGGHFAPDGRSVYLLTNRDSEFHRLVRLDLATGGWTVLTGAIAWDVMGFDLSEDGTLLAFVTNEDGLSRLHLMDPRTGSELPAPELPPGVAGSPEFRPGSREIAFVLSWARSPSDVYSYDPDGAAPGRPGELVRWTESEVGGLDLAEFPIPELVRFPTFDHEVGEGGEPGPRRQIPAFIFRPDAERFPGPRPVMISIHGGPEGQWRPSFLGSENYFLNELGIVLVYPNVRGSTGYGATYVNLDNGRLRRDSVRDIGALLDWIDSRPELDGKRVMVFGGSYGGYMVLASLVEYSDRLAAGIDVVGISNFVTFLENTRDYRRDLRRAEYGDEQEPEMRKFLTEISPANQVAKIRKPVLVVQGANDPRVPLSESDQVVAALQAQGTPVWYMVAEDEGHGFRKKKNSDYFRAVAIEFARRHLLPAPPGAGAAAGQP